MERPKTDGLELDDDPRFQERFWKVQRIAWLFLLLIVVAALAGLSGQGGPFAKAMVEGATGSVTHPRVTRWETSDEMRLTLPDSGGDQATVDIGTAFSDIFEIEDIQPAPAESYSTVAGQRLVFDLRGPEGQREIVLHIRAMRPSLATPIDIRIDDGPLLRMAPVVLP